MIEIHRWECEFLTKNKNWLLVYGRRKVGKTWLLRRCLKWSLYVTVTRGGTCIVERRRDRKSRSFQGIHECVNIVVEELRNEGSVVVVDEFQRLPEEYWDLIALEKEEAKGILVLCGSSMGIVDRVFDKRSPLLGVVGAFHVKLASVPDTIASLLKVCPAREAVLWAPLARDPWVLAHIEVCGEPWRVLAEKAWTLVPAAQGLLGEVFFEEERQLTRLYEGVLRLLALGVWNVGALAQKLYSAGLTSTPHPSAVTGVLHALEEMGLVSRLPLWKTRRARIYYRHSSSLLALLFYLDELTAGLELEIPTETLKTRYALELQFIVGELLAEFHQLRRSYTILPGGEGDIDIVLLDKKGRPQIGYEVKVGPVSKKDIEKLLERTKRLGIPRTGIISLTNKPDTEIVDEALGPEELAQIALKLTKRRNHSRFISPIK